MSALSPAGSVRPASARERARMTDLVAAEWLKLWSPWHTAAASAGVVVLSAVISQHDPRPVAFDAPTWLLPMAAAGLLGAQTLVAEHATGLLRSTLTAVPDRRRVAAAKAVVVVAVSAVVALVLACTDLVLMPQAQADAVTSDRIAACVVLGPVCGLAGMAVAALARHPAATAAGVCFVLGVLPLFLQPKQNRWEVDACNVLPYYAWSRLASHTGGTMTAPVAWGTLVAWAVAAFLLTTVVLDRRDV